MLNLEKASKKFDKLIHKTTKKGFEKWLAMDTERSKSNVRKEFTKQFIIDNRDCNSYEQIISYSFMNKDTILLLELLQSEMIIQDKCYFVYQKCNLNVEQKKDLSLLLSQSIKQRYSDNKTIEEYFQAIESYDLEKLAQISNQLRSPKTLDFRLKEAFGAILNVALMLLASSEKDIIENADWSSIHIANFVYVIDTKNNNKFEEEKLIETITKYFNLNKMKNKQLQIVRGDITEMPVECIVNAANAYLAPGGGVCGAIYKKAGPELEEETKQYPSIEVGGALATGGYNLCPFVIHAVGPIYGSHTPEEAKALLISAYVESLSLAEELKVKTLAFPIISSGIYGYPKEEAIQIALNVLNHAEDFGNFDNISLVCFLEEDYEIAIGQQEIIEGTFKE